MAKILIVDDSSVMRKNLKSFLESVGHEVLAEIADGRELLSSYSLHQPDVVTLDISMPITDGISALKTLMIAFPKAKVVMVSALGQKQQVLEAIRSGAKSYVVKPIDREKFLEIVTRVAESP